MISLTRRGPKIILIESNSINNLSNYLEKNFFCSCASLSDAFEHSNENSTIILLVETIKEIVTHQDIRNVFLIELEADVILCTIMNHNMGHLVTRSRIAPHIILMRVFGDTEKILKEIKKDHTADTGSFLDILDTHNDKGTIIAFTQKPLNKSIRLSDLYEKSLVVEESYSTLHKYLRIHSLKYLNEGLDNKDWYELEIKIYDMYGAYMLHYQRLLSVIENLELGIILGESWGKDYPRMFMSVGVYRIRFFTFFDPTYIKRILVGLEYLDDSTRIVDYDIYHRRKKIDWVDVKEKHLATRFSLSQKYRNEILTKLDKEEQEELIDLEAEILKTRE